MFIRELFPIYVSLASLLQVEIRGHVSDVNEKYHFSPLIKAKGISNISFEEAQPYFPDV